MMEFSIDEQIKCLAREIAFREKVYPSWIQQGRITEQNAQYQIECMKSIIRILETLPRTTGQMNLLDGVPFVPTYEAQL